MANEEEGVVPPATNPPDTRILDERIKTQVASMFGGGGPGAGDGSGGDTAARLAKVEADVKNIGENLSDARQTLRTMNESLTGMLTRMATIDSELRHLPSKGYIVRAVSGVLALLAAFLLFQHQIQQLFGLVPIAGK